jgi:hypothetical protein
VIAVRWGRKKKGTAPSDALPAELASLRLWTLYEDGPPGAGPCNLLTDGPRSVDG